MKKIFNKPTILLLSQQLDIKRWVRRLVGEDFFLLEEKNSAQALAVSKTTNISYILIDASIEEDILSLAQKIKEEAHLETTPILLLSGKLNKNFHDQALKAGVSGLIPPFAEKQDFLEKLLLAQKVLATKQKISSFSEKIKKIPLPSNSPSLKKRMILSEQILKEIKKLLQENPSSLLLIAEIDSFSRYQKEEYEEMQKICQEEWKKIFSEKKPLLSLQPGKYLSFFPLSSSQDLEGKVKIFQNNVRRASLNKNPFSLSIFITHLQQKEFLKNEEISSFFEQIFLKVEEKLETSPTGQFFSLDLQG